MTRKFVLEAALVLAACVTFTHSVRAQSPSRSAELLPVPAKVLNATPAVPGTLATNTTPAPNLKPQDPFSVRLQPDSLPSWVTNQPLAYLRYGAAPAVVTLHFGHKEKAHED
jgi:hypothetical protein